MAKDDVHVVIIPFCAFGHMIPNFLLSLALAKSGIHVHYIATPRNIQRLPKIPPHLSPLFHLISIPFPPLEPDFLPDGAEATMDVPFDKFDNLKVAYDLLQPQVKHFIVELMPDWIISDYAAHWVVDIAEEHGVPLAYFSLFNAACSVFFGPPENLLGTKRDGGLPTPESLTLAPDWVPFPSAVAFRPFEAKYVARGFFGVNGSGISDAARLAKVLSASQVVGIRTCEEVEGDYLQVYREITGKKVIPTGLLPPEKPTNDGGPSSTHDDEIFGWLGKQETKSVVYVGFGSECKLSKDQVFAIAHGLELSGLPFFWALRKPDWADTKADALPTEFYERTSEKGLVCMEWVPQMQILGHPSVGGSLSHSGWSSVIELLQFGHVIVTLPVSADQPMNARLTEEKGLAVEVKRQEDGSFSKEEIAKTLRQAMVGEEGEELRSNARKAALVFGDHKLHQDHYMGQFVLFLRSNVSKRSS